MLLEMLFSAVDRVENDVRKSSDNHVLVHEAHDPMDPAQQKPDRAFGSPLVVPSSSAPDARGGQGGSALLTSPSLIVPAVPASRYS